MKLLRRTLLSLPAAALLLTAADPGLLKLVPADARMIAGIDVDRARNSAFGQRIMAQIKEDDKGFQEFVAATGFDPRRDMREVVVAGTETTNKGLVLMRGAFDMARIRATLVAKGATAVSYQGVELWSTSGAKGGEGAISILDSTLAVAGSEDMVKAALDLRNAPSSLPAPLASKINTWSANYDAWFVANGPLGANAARMGTLNGSANIPIDSVQEAAAGVRIRADLEIAAEAVMRSPQDATALADIVRFLASMVRGNAGKNGIDENTLKILDTLQVSTAGSVTRLSVTVPEQSLEKILERKHEGRKSTRASR
jgi:hypothetical protein